MVSRRRWNSHETTRAWGQVVAKAATTAPAIRVTTAMSTQINAMGLVSLGGGGGGSTMSSVDGNSLPP